MTIRRYCYHFCLFIFAATALGRTQVSFAGNGEVLSHGKISSTQGNFTGALDDNDLFGICVTSLGDLDGDGGTDVVVGTSQDDDGGVNRGAVWVLFLLPDGTVKSHQKISDQEGGFLGRLDDIDNFGIAVASVGDINRDGVTDLAVGAHGDDDGGYGQGALWILFLRPDGTVRGHQKISETAGNFTGTLSRSDLFGSSVADLGDLDDDGTNDVAVGAPFDDDLSSESGAVWILFLNVNGTVKKQVKISNSHGGFTGKLAGGDVFGRSIACLGDIDGDGLTEIAVGAVLDDNGGEDHGAVWVLSLKSNGTVASQRKISSTKGGFTGQLDVRDQFGISLASLGDLDGDRIGDLAVGANTDDDGGLHQGAVWVLFLTPEGTVKSHQKISAVAGNFDGNLDDSDLFGIALASLGDINGDGFADIAVGATDDDDGGSARGAVWTLLLDGALQPAIALQSFESFWNGDHVEVTWKLTVDFGPNLVFEVHRWEGPIRSPVRIDDPRIREADGVFTFEDHSVEPGKTYSYYVVVIEDTVVVASFETTTITPVPAFALHQNHPNPFGPRTRIDFALDREEHVSLAIYDVSGKLVRALVNRRLPVGNHLAEWDGRNRAGSRVPNGIYFYRLKASRNTMTRKAVLVR